jgi:hypothetical protein
MKGYEISNDIHFGYMTYGWKALEVKFSMVQISSRLEFPTESYNCFSGQKSAETAAV